MGGHQLRGGRGAVAGGGLGPGRAAAGTQAGGDAARLQQLRGGRRDCRDRGHHLQLRPGHPVERGPAGGQEGEQVPVRGWWSVFTPSVSQGGKAGAEAGTTVAREMGDITACSLARVQVPVT